MIAVDRRRFLGAGAGGMGLLGLAGAVPAWAGDRPRPRPPLHKAERYHVPSRPRSFSVYPANWPPTLPRIA